MREKISSRENFFYLESKIFCLIFRAVFMKALVKEALLFNVMSKIARKINFKIYF